MVIGAYAHLIAPVNFRALGLGPLADGRILGLQPVLYRLRVLLVGPLQRLLRREAPTLQVATGRPHRHGDVELTLDELLHRGPGPQRMRHLDLIRTAILHRSRHQRRLVRLQAGGAWPSLALGFQRLGAPTPVLLDPAVHCSAGYTEDARRVRLRHPAPHRFHDAHPYGLLGLRGELSGILAFHAPKTTTVTNA